MTVLRILLGLLAVASLVVFVRRAKELYTYLTLGEPDPVDRTNNASYRLKEAAKYVLGQFCSRRPPYTAVGIMHTVIFWGFVLLFPTAVEAVLRIIFPSFSFAFLGSFLYGILTLLQDIFALGVLVAIIAAFIRRYVVKPERVENHWDAPVILGLITGVVLTFFGMNMAELKFAHEGVRPISQFFASILGPDTVQGAYTLYLWSWGLHTAILLVFLPLLLYSKHLHILAGAPNVYMQNLEGFKQFRMDFENSEFFGVNRIDQFSWKDLFDSYACTYCNRCTDQCPAHFTGKPLEPGKMIQSMRDILLEDAPKIMAAFEDGKKPAPDAEIEGVEPLIGRLLDKDAIWACTTCGACLNICPTKNEHPQKVIQMRRYLALMEGDIPEEMGLAFRNMENNFNPWGVGFAARADWAEGLDVPLMADKKEAEYLLWVGCAGAYDDRYKKVMKAFVEILKAAGVDFAILGTEEKCCGDSARRLGNEYLFEMLAMENAEILKAYNVKKIITACPHGYHVLKHEYSQYGWEGEVWHHTEFIAKLLREGRIKLAKGLPKLTVYHDSCYLGRHNGIYEDPRFIISNIVPAAKIKEMRRNGELSFCCGAGGGRMWLEETIGKRINVERAEEAIDTGAELVVTACPFCLTMFDDGIKNKGKEEEIQLKDIAEIVREAMEE